MSIALAYDKWASAMFPRRTRMLRGHSGRFGERGRFSTSGRISPWSLVPWQGKLKRWGSILPGRRL